MKVVRSLRKASMASLTRASVSTSSALVASSSTRIGAFSGSRGQFATRWRSPPDSRLPRSPTTVVVAVEAVLDEIARGGGLGGCHHLVQRGVVTAEADIFADRAGS